MRNHATRSAHGPTTRLLSLYTLAAGAILLAGCASSKSGGSAAFKDQQYAAQPPTVKFGEFTRVELKHTALTPKDAKSEANQKSAQIIDEMLLDGLRTLWPDIAVVPAGGEFSNSADRTLQISPSITTIKLVSVGSRIWFGVMAGGSDIVMHVDYTDNSTGAIIANPDFWKGNNAWAGGTSWGAKDNQIRDAVVGQILNYTQANR